MFYKHDLSLKLIEDYKSIVESLNPLLLKFHTEALNSKGINIHMIESTFLDHNNAKYIKHNGLTFSVIPDMDVYNKHFKPQYEEQIENEYKLYNDYIYKTQASDFVESNLKSLFTVGTYDQETFTKLERGSRGMFLDVADFTHFYHQLCRHILVDYEYKSKKKGMVVFEKALQSGYVLSAKYHENELKSDLKLGHLRFPSLSFWISDKSTKEDFLLGMDEHPFTLGIMSPNTYLASELVVKIGDASYEIMSPVEIVQDGDTYTIKPNEKLLLNLKKQLTDYMNFKTPFKKSIINYYEEVAKEIIENDNMIMLSKSS